MSRPNVADSIVRRDLFAALLAEDLHDHRAPRADMHARIARLDTGRALRLSWEPGFLAQVARMANVRQAARHGHVSAAVATPTHAGETGRRPQARQAAGRDRSDLP